MAQTYDLADHVKTKTYPSGRSVTYNYDVSGDLSSFTGNLGDGTARTYSTSLLYNPQGQMTREQFGTTTALYHRRHYNSRGQLFDVRLGTDSNTNNDGPDPSQWTGTSWNRGALRAYFSSNTVEYSWPAVAPQLNNGNLYRQDVFVPTTLDGSGNITNWVLGVDYYSYDSLNRLVAVNELPAASWAGNGNLGWLLQAYSQRYKYDRFANRTLEPLMSWGIGINRKAFAVDGPTNRLGVPVGQIGAMGYDAVGNLTNDTYTGGGTRAYDAENRMLTAVGGNGQTNSYVYDADGHRTRRTLNNSGEMWWQVYGVGGELVGEYQVVSGTPTLKKEYGYRNGQLLVIADTVGACQWLVTDALGTPRMLVDKTGSLSGMKRRDYLPFGEELLAGTGHRQASDGYASALGQEPRQQFTSKERDSETGLDYFEARYYSSVQGRFTSPDEFMGGPDELYDFADVAANNPTFYADLTDPQSLNKYQYCYNNPLAYTDSDGHKGLREWAKQAVEVAADFTAGVSRGVIASVSGGVCSLCNPSSNDSIASRAGQVLGTAIVGGIGTSSALAGGAAIIGTGGAAAALVIPVAAVVAGTAAAVGAAKNAGALVATPMQMASKSKMERGTPGGRRKPSEEQANRIRERDDNKCYYCGKDTIRSKEPHPDRSNIDHKKPYAKGGKTTDDNLVNACQQCNLGKGKMSEKEFRNKMKEQEQ